MQMYNRERWSYLCLPSMWENSMVMGRNYKEHLEITAHFNQLHTMADLILSFVD